MKDDEEQDDDSFLGGGAWAAVTSAIIEIRKNKQKNAAFLHLHDLRLEAPAKAIIELKVDEFGFFSTKAEIMDPGQMLTAWPFCFDEDEVKKLSMTTRSMNDVFRDIAAKTETSFESVKKLYQRHPEADYPWKKLLE